MESRISASSSGGKASSSVFPVAGKSLGLLGGSRKVREVPESADLFRGGGGGGGDVNEGCQKGRNGEGVSSKKTEGTSWWVKETLKLTTRSIEANADDGEESEVIDEDAREGDARVDAEEEVGREDDVEGAELEDDEGSGDSDSVEPSIRDRPKRKDKHS